jgi:hypothetical protein
MLKNDNIKEIEMRINKIKEGNVISMKKGRGRNKGFVNLMVAKSSFIENKYSLITMSYSGEFCANNWMAVHESIEKIIEMLNLTINSETYRDGGFAIFSDVQKWIKSGRI